MRQQHLVSADCCQDHSAVVCQTPMPYAVIEVEQVLELGMKRLHGRLAAPVEGTPTTRFQERPARVPQTAMALALLRLSAGRWPRAGRTPPRHLRAEEPASVRPACFHCFGNGVAVVTRISQHILRCRGQVRHFFQNRFLLRPAGRIDRGQQRPDHALLRSRHYHFKGVALYPAVVVGVTPRRVCVHSAGHMIAPPISGLPGPTPPRYQAFVHSRTLRIGPTPCYRCCPLQYNRSSKEAMNASITLVKGGAAGHLLPRQPALEVRMVLRPPHELSRFGLFPQHDGHHNHHGQDPIGNRRFAPWSRARRFLLRPLTKRDAEGNQFIQERAIRGSLWHSGNPDLAASFCLAATNANQRSFPDLGQTNSRTASEVLRRAC